MYCWCERDWISYVWTVLESCILYSVEASTSVPAQGSRRGQESFDFASFPIIFSLLFVAYWEALLPTVATGCNKPSEWETIECIKCLLDKSMYLAEKPPNVPKLVHHNLSIMMSYYLRKRRLRSPCMKRPFRKGVKTGVYDERTNGIATQGTTHMRSLTDTNFWSEHPRKDWNILVQTAPKHLYLYFCLVVLEGEWGLCDWETITIFRQWVQGGSIIQSNRAVVSRG